MVKYNAVEIGIWWLVPISIMLDLQPSKMKLVKEESKKKKIKVWNYGRWSKLEGRELRHSALRRSLRCLRRLFFWVKSLKIINFEFWFENFPEFFARKWSKMNSFQSVEPLCRICVAYWSHSYLFPRILNFLIHLLTQIFDAYCN